MVVFLEWVGEEILSYQYNSALGNALISKFLCSNEILL